MACSQEPSVGSTHSNGPPTYCFLRESLPTVICSLHHLPETFPHSHRAALSNTSAFNLPCSTSCSCHAARSPPHVASSFFITFSWLFALFLAVPNAWDNLWLMFSKQPPPQIRLHPSVLCFLLFSTIPTDALTSSPSKGPNLELTEQHHQFLWGDWAARCAVPLHLSVSSQRGNSWMQSSQQYHPQSENLSRACSYSLALFKHGLSRG